MFVQPHEKPTVFVTTADLEDLTEIADTGRTAGAVLLARELERAVVLADDEAPHAFVRLDAEVTYRDLLTERMRTVTVVRPADADMEHNRLSVLTPVGAALFGLTAGDTFGFATDDGRPRVLEVLEVSAPATGATGDDPPRDAARRRAAPDGG
jgi:regulator of nucleoside diphosphate kinase